MPVRKKKECGPRSPHEIIRHLIGPCLSLLMLLLDGHIVKAAVHHPMRIDLSLWVPM